MTVILVTLMVAGGVTQTVILHSMQRPTVLSRHLCHLQPLTGSDIGKVRLHPVLLDKGGTRLALYGLGNIRDERLARMFQTPGCLEWCASASVSRLMSSSSMAHISNWDEAASSASDVGVRGVMLQALSHICYTCTCYRFQVSPCGTL